MQQLNDPFRLSAPVMSTPGPVSRGPFTYQHPHKWRRVPRALPENSHKVHEAGKRGRWGGGEVGAVTQRGGRRRWNLNVLKPGGGRKKKNSCIITVTTCSAVREDAAACFQQHGILALIPPSFSHSGGHLRAHIPAHFSPLQCD